MVSLVLPHCEGQVQVTGVGGSAISLRYTGGSAILCHCVKEGGQ